MYRPINSHSLSLCRHTHEHLQLHSSEYITPDPEVSYYMLYNTGEKTTNSLLYVRLDGRRRRSLICYYSGARSKCNA
jgi:hypothetical protein